MEESGARLLDGPVEQSLAIRSSEDIWGIIFKLNGASKTLKIEISKLKAPKNLNESRNRNVAIKIELGMLIAIEVDPEAGTEIEIGIEK